MPNCRRGSSQLWSAEGVEGVVEEGGGEEEEEEEEVRDMRRNLMRGRRVLGKRVVSTASHSLGPVEGRGWGRGGGEETGYLPNSLRKQ